MGGSFQFVTLSREEPGVLAAIVTPIVVVKCNKNTLLGYSAMRMARVSRAGEV